MHTKAYTFPYFYSKYLVLFTTAPRNNGPRTVSVLWHPAVPRTTRLGFSRLFSFVRNVYAVPVVSSTMTWHRTAVYSVHRIALYSSIPVS